LEYLKRTKDNISMFELMKLPQIQDNFIKMLHGTTSKNTKEANVGGSKGKGKLGQIIDKTTPKKKSVVNASLTGQRSKSNTSPFLLTFEIFNKNVHNYMVDSGSSSNVMSLKFYGKLNVKSK
jgi:hypothetical protein